MLKLVAATRGVRGTGRGRKASGGCDGGDAEAKSVTSERDILEYVNYVDEDERLESRVRVQRGAAAVLGTFLVRILVVAT
jgi:hypothetical protein